MLIVTRNSNSDDVEKGLGKFGQGVKLRHRGGKGKKRKNMPGYYLGTDKLGRPSWKAVDTVEAVYEGPKGKEHYIKELSKPGDVIKHKDENFTVLGRLEGKLVVLDPKNSHIKLVAMENEPSIVVRQNIQDLFVQDPVLLQRKVMGRYLSVKDILEHPDNHTQAKDLFDKGLLKLPENFKLADQPNMELLKQAPAMKPAVKKVNPQEQVTEAPQSKAPQEPAAPKKRFEIGETFKARDYYDTAEIGDKLVTSKDTHWTVVGKGVIREKKKDADGNDILTGTESRVILVTSNGIDGVYALQVDTGNRTYTMLEHGKSDSIQAEHLQKQVIVKSKRQGYNMKQLLDGSYVVAFEKNQAAKKLAAQPEQPKPQQPAVAAAPAPQQAAQANATGDVYDNIAKHSDGFYDVDNLQIPPKGKFQGKGAFESYWAQDAQGNGYLVKRADTYDGSPAFQHLNHTALMFPGGGELVANRVANLIGMPTNEVRLGRNSKGEIFTIHKNLKDAVVVHKAFQMEPRDHDFTKGEDLWTKPLSYADPQKWAEQRGRMMVMDAFIGNIDRHEGNAMVGKDGTLYAIDHGLLKTFKEQGLYNNVTGELVGKLSRHKADHPIRKAAEEAMKRIAQLTDEDIDDIIEIDSRLFTKAESKQKLREELIASRDRIKAISEKGLSIAKKIPKHNLSQILAQYNIDANGRFNGNKNAAGLKALDKKTPFILTRVGNNDKEDSGDPGLSRTRSPMISEEG